MPITKKWLLAGFIALIGLAGQADKVKPPPFIGVFENKKGGMDRLTVILQADGKGALIGMAFGPFLWRVGSETNHIILNYSSTRQQTTIEAIFDPKKKELKFLPGPSSSAETLYYTTNLIPRRLSNMLLHFDGTENSLTHGCTETIFALGMANREKDLSRIQKVLVEEGLPSRLEGGIAGVPDAFLSIDKRDVARARSYVTNEIAKASLSIRLRASSDTNLFELWHQGRVSSVELYRNGQPVPTWVRQ